MKIQGQDTSATFQVLCWGACWYDLYKAKKQIPAFLPIIIEEETQCLGQKEPLALQSKDFTSRSTSLADIPEDMKPASSEQSQEQ